MRTKIKYCIFAFAILFTACSEEAIRVNPPDNSSLRVRVSLPANDGPTTRADQVNESDIYELDVIIFKRVKIINEYHDMYHDYYPVPSFTGETGEDGIHRKIFEMTIDPEILSQSVGARVMIFANCRDSLETFLETVDENTTREYFHKEFSMHCLLKEEGKLLPFGAMPMCGINASHIVNNGSGEIPYIGVDLFRMFARIDIGVDIDGNPNSELRQRFQIQKVSVLGTVSKGNVVRNFEEPLYNPTPEKTNIPTHYLRIMDRYRPVVDYVENEGNAMKKVIYVPETEALDLESIFSYQFIKDDGTFGSFIENKHPLNDGVPYNGTFIILETIVSGEEGRRYYRIDFVNKYGDYLPLIRNHKYEINITKVTHGGYPNKYDVEMYYYKPNSTRTGESGNSGLEYEINMK